MSRVTRAQSLTPSKTNEYFSDFLNSFAKTPVGNQLAKVSNERSINQALTTLEFYIRNAIEINEPRVNLLQILLEAGQNDHELVINIIYNTINNPTPTLFNYILKRVR
jgi:phage baseplate assembly protein W